jgi:hypothetical protein
MSSDMPLELICYKDTPDAWQTRVQERTGLPFPIPWILIAAAVFALGYGILRLCGESPNAVRMLAIECALIAAIANSVVFYEKLLDDVADAFPILLDEDDDTAREWVARWYAFTFHSKKNLVMGAFLGCMCALSGASGSATVFESVGGRAYAGFVAFAVGFLGGSMFWAMLGVAGLTLSLGKDVRIRPSIFDSKTSILRTASSVLWKVSLTASMVFILGVSIYYFCSLSIGPLLLAIVLFFGVFIVLYFVLPQLNIHKTLVTIKRTRLKVLVQQIDRTFDTVTTEPSAENINQLRDLFQLQGIVNGKRSWSFGTGELLILIGSVLTPLLLFLLNHFLK